MHVDRISKNHIINNLVEAYIKEHPGECILRLVMCFMHVLVCVFYVRERGGGI